MDGIKTDAGLNDDTSEIYVHLVPLGRGECPSSYLIAVVETSGQVFFSNEH